MIRIVAVYEDTTAPIVSEVPDWDYALFEFSNWAQLPRLSSVSFQVVSQWWPATWQQVLSGCEVLGDDGKTWVVSRGLSQASPHEVEIYEFGRPDNRFTFTPRYDQPVQARFTHEAQMMALLMTELGARVVDHEERET
jgi:hypothetical protein